jgi:hypothetical protein
MLYHGGAERGGHAGALADVLSRRRGRLEPCLRVDRDLSESVTARPGRLGLGSASDCGGRLFGMGTRYGLP